MNPTAVTPDLADAGQGTALDTVDCDVHPHLRQGMASLAPFLSESWKRRLLGASFGKAWSNHVYASAFTLPHNNLYINPVGAMRRDAFPEDGSVPAGTAEQVVSQLLEPSGISRAILIPGNTLGLGALPDADAAAAVAAATNEWIAEEWLTVDERLRASIVVAPQDPALAAEEIERRASQRGFVQVFLPLMNILMGERHYYPIYEAAARNGLPIALHPNSVDGIYQKAATMAGGVPTYYVEWHSGLSQVFQANVLSLVCHGVFERFPQLRVVIAEGGFAWLPDVMWRLDKDWEALRDEVPWLKRRPSEYVFDHVRFTTQPIPEPAKREHLHALCDMIQAERTLIFSSDFPHWDFDNPARAVQSLPAAMRERILSTNARELYGERLV